jgi:hypothetical protein
MGATKRAQPRSFATLLAASVETMFIIGIARMKPVVVTALSRRFARFDIALVKLYHVHRVSRMPALEFGLSELHVEKPDAEDLKEVQCLDNGNVLK